jgi:hypothetical protein
VNDGSWPKIIAEETFLSKALHEVKELLGKQTAVQLFAERDPSLRYLELLGKMRAVSRARSAGLEKIRSGRPIKGRTRAAMIADSRFPRFLSRR